MRKKNSSAKAMRSLGGQISLLANLKLKFKLLKRTAFKNLDICIPSFSFCSHLHLQLSHYSYASNISEIDDRQVSARGCNGFKCNSRMSDQMSVAALQSAALLRQSQAWDKATRKKLHSLGFPFTKEFILEVLRFSAQNIDMALKFFLWTEQLQKERKGHCVELYEFMARLLIATENYESIFYKHLNSYFQNPIVHFAPEPVFRLLIRCRGILGLPVMDSELLKMIVKNCEKLTGRVYLAVLKALVLEGFLAEALAFYNENVVNNVIVDVVAINEMISGLINRQMIEEAAAFLERLEVETVFAPKKSWCSVLVRELCNGMQADRAYLIVSNVLQRTDNNTSYLNICVDAFCKVGCMLKAEMLVAESVSWGFAPNTVTFNSLIDGYCRKDKVEEAWYLLERMKKFGSVPDLISYNTLLRGFNQKSMLLHSLNAFEEMINNGITPDVWTYNILIHGFFMCGRPAEANKLMHDMVARSVLPCSKTYNTILNGLCKIGKIQDALRMFSDLRSVNFSPDIVTYNIIINGLCKANQLSNALDVLKDARGHGHVLDIITYTTLIKFCFKSGKFEEGLMLCTEMLREGHIPDSFAYSTMITGLVKLGRLEEVKVCVKQMLITGVDLDAVAYNSMINAFFKAQDPEKAFQMWHDMEYRGCHSDAYTDAIIIDGLCKMGNVEAAYRHFKSVSGKDCSRDLVSYNILIKGFGKAGKVDKAINLFNEMHERDHITYSSLIRALCRAERVLNAYHFLLCCLKHNIQVYESAFDAVLASLHDSGYYREARKLRAVIQLNKVLQE